MLFFSTKLFKNVLYIPFWIYSSPTIFPLPCFSPSFYISPCFSSFCYHQLLVFLTIFEFLFGNVDFYSFLASTCIPCFMVSFSPFCFVPTGLFVLIIMMATKSDDNDDMSPTLLLCLLVPYVSLFQQCDNPCKKKKKGKKSPLYYEVIVWQWIIGNCFHALYLGFIHHQRILTVFLFFLYSHTNTYCKHIVCMYECPNTVVSL